jgi:hypothetical protein
MRYQVESEIHAVRGCSWRPACAGRSRRASRTAFLIALLFLVAPPIAAQGALNVDDVVTMLQYRDAPPDLLADVREEMIRDRCVSFQLNQEATTRLRAAGADTRLLAAIRGTCYRGTETEAGREALRNAWRLAHELFRAGDFAGAAVLYGDVYRGTSGDNRRAPAANWARSLFMVLHQSIREQVDTDRSASRNVDAAREQRLQFQFVLSLLEESQLDADAQILTATRQHLEIIEAVLRASGG